MKVLRIKDWERNFETHETRKLRRLYWVPIPNKQDGDGYTELLEHPDGAAHFGAWSAIVQVASKCAPRGTLARSGDRPHDAGTISRQTRMGVEIVAAAIERLLGIGWLEWAELEPSGGSNSSEKANESAVLPGCREVLPETRHEDPAEGKGPDLKGPVQSRRVERPEPRPESIEEVIAFWTSEALPGDPRRFFLWHEDRGWKWKSWKRSAKSWALKDAPPVTSKRGRYSDVVADEVIKVGE